MGENSANLVTLPTTEICERMTDFITLPPGPFTSDEYREDVLLPHQEVQHLARRRKLNFLNLQSYEWRYNLEKLDQY
jgi:hypothetical protein